MKKLILVLLLILVSLSFASPAGYRYRQEITLNSTVNSTLSNFPVGITLDTATLISGSKMLSSCNDLRVTLPNDTALSYDVENCNSTISIVWIKIPSFLNSTIAIELFYGNTTTAAGASGTNATDVFSNGYISVWHGDGNYNDVFGTNNLSCTGTCNFETLITKCRFGKCFNMTTTTTNLNRTTATTILGNNASTLEAWSYKTAAQVAQGTLFNQGSNTNGRMLIWSTAGTINSSVAGSYYAPVTWAGSQTQYLILYAITYDGTNVTTYVNGTTATAAATPASAAGGIWFGQSGFGTNYWTNPVVTTFDEMRLSNVSRSKDWLTAEQFATATAGTEQYLQAYLSENTTNSTMYITLWPTSNFTSYNITASWNDYVILQENATGSRAIKTWNISLNNYPILINSSTIPFNVTVNYTGGPTIESLNYSIVPTVLLKQPLLNYTFYDDISLAQINIDSVANEYDIFLSNGSTKVYGFGVSGIGTIQNFTMNAYPSIYTANLSTNEIYSKVGFGTRSRFTVHATVPFNTQQNINIYLLNLSAPNSAYSIINVLRNGNPIDGAYVQVLKYYGSSGLYINIDQKVTNSQGMAGGYYTIDGFYKFAIYDGSGNQLYYSAVPEQFLPQNGQYQVTIDVSNPSALQYITPYYSANCYGNNASNAIVFAYADQTGLTHNVTFLAWRASNISGYGPPPVCNTTISGSSAGYTCNLTAGENLTWYAYTCAVDVTASPSMRIFGYTIDYSQIQAMTDWILIVVFGLIGFGAIAVNPGIGMITVASFVALLYYWGVVTIPLGSLVGIIGVALIGAFLMWRDD